MSTNVSMGREDITIINIYRHDNNFFFGYDTKSTNNKSKNQVGMSQTKKFLYNKRNNQQNEKATYKMGENICKPYIG